MYNYIISIDFGVKHIGLAITQDMTFYVTSLKYIYIESKKDWNKIIKEINKWNPISIIVGLNTYNKGFLKKINIFIKFLKKKIFSNFYFQDEYFTTLIAKAELKTLNIKKKELVHIMAAKIILNDWILKNNKSIY